MANKQILSKTLSSFRKTNIRIGYVPTMGALHQGHLTLVRRAIQENDVVVVSIFVNPTQFNNPNDLKRYPRTIAQDTALLETLKGDIYIFTPTAEELYGDKIISSHYNYSGLDQQMEGKHRKGHFDGVGTVLNLLFRAIDPQTAYFGEKDFQQLQIVKKLVEIEKLPIKIVGCKIIREPNGLAMSSRNKLLSPTEFTSAALINQTLEEVKRNFKTKTIHQLNQFVINQFAKNPDLNLEYFKITNEKTLKTAIRKHPSNSYRGFIAAYASEVRLIDNMALN